MKEAPLYVSIHTPQSWQQNQSVKKRVGVFGPPRDTAALLREIKLSFDPAGILNAG